MIGRAAIRRVVPAAGALTLYAGLAAWLLDFRLDYAGSRLPGGLGDPVLVLYFLEWGGRSILRGLAGFWDANFYFPATGVMTLSDHMLGPAAQSLLCRGLRDNGVAAYNVLFLGSFALSGLAVAWVLRRSGASTLASVLAGVMFAFSPYRSSQESHLQVLIMQWIPLTLWGWDRLLARPGFGTAAAFTVCYLLHLTGGIYLAYLMHFALAIVLLQHLGSWRRLLRWRSLRAVAPALAICAAVALALFLPYLEARRDLGLERTPGEIGFYGATLGSYFSIEAENELWGGLLGRGRPENRLFAGALTLLFAAAGLAHLVNRRIAAATRSEDGGAPGGGDGSASSRPALGPGPSPTWRRGVLWSGLFFFLLSFAPVFVSLARILPGLQAMRVPTRGYPFVSLALVVLAAAGMDRLLPRAPWRRALVGAAIAVALALELDTKLSWHAWPREAAELEIFHEIARRPEVKAVLHLPILADAREAHYMYYSTLHWKPIANGYSGFAPATYLELRRRLTDEPLVEETLDHLLELGITHVGAHPRLLRAPRGRRRLARWEKRFAEGPAPRIRLVASAGEDRLYELLPRPGRSWRRGGAPVEATAAGRAP